MDGLGVFTLKSWTGKANATIIFDSDVDEYTDDGLFKKVKGKRNVALVAFTADGDVFGGFYNVAVTEQNNKFYEPNMFVFSFESHGRCMTPQRFVVKEDKRRYKSVEFFKNRSFGWFVNYGVNYGFFILGNEKSNSLCANLSSGFEGIEDDTLTGNTYPRRSFTCTRIVAVYLGN